MPLAYHVLNNIESNTLVSNLLSSKPMSADDKIALASSWSIIPDLINVVIHNLNLRSNEYEYISSGEPLIEQDYDLLLRIIQLSFCILVSLALYNDPETIRKSLEPVLRATFELMTRLLTTSFQRYFFKDTEIYKYPLEFVIKLCSLQFPICIKPYLLDNIVLMVSAALRAAGQVCSDTFNVLYLRFLYVIRIYMHSFFMQSTVPELPVQIYCSVEDITRFPAPILKLFDDYSSEKIECSIRHFSTGFFHNRVEAKRWGDLLSRSLQNKFNFQVSICMLKLLFLLNNGANTVVVQYLMLVKLYSLTCLFSGLRISRFRYFWVFSTGLPSA